MKLNWWVWILFLGVRLSAQTITIEPTNQVVTIGRNATFSATVSGGTGPFTYQWQFNGTNLPLNIITTIAGNGVAGVSLDHGVAATNVSLNYPSSLTLDIYGNLFFSDAGNNEIREVDTNGLLWNIAGKFIAGYSGDGGYAIYAELNSPEGLVVDSFGNIFFADEGNFRIRKCGEDAYSGITTVAGGGSSLGSGIQATNAYIVFPGGVALDKHGNMYIPDYGNCRVCKVDLNGIITTIAGNGTKAHSGDGGAATNASLDFPQSVALDAYGNLFISEFQDGDVRKIDTNGIITTIAGNGTNSFSGDGGAATNASLEYPNGIAIDLFGNVFIADNGNSRIREVSTNGIITTFAGNTFFGYSGDGGSATNATLQNPSGVTVDSFGNLYIADSGNNVIRKVSAFGSLPTLTLNNVTTNDDGNYNVIITGAQGSVTSSIVTLTATMLPTITSQPQPLTVTNGCPASFVVAADGWPSLTYQWFFNGTNLLASTNTTLALLNAFPVNTGAYTVIITNAYGSITSNPAMLTVLPLGINAPTMLASGQFQLSFDTATGVNYTVEYSTNLTQWFPFVTLGGIGLPLTLIDPNTASSQQRFYRIILSPQ